MGIFQDLPGEVGGRSMARFCSLGLRSGGKSAQGSGTSVAHNSALSFR